MVRNARVHGRAANLDTEKKGWSTYAADGATRDNPDWETLHHWAGKVKKEETLEEIRLSKDSGTILVNSAGEDARPVKKMSVRSVRDHCHIRRRSGESPGRGTHA